MPSTVARDKRIADGICRQCGSWLAIPGKTQCFNCLSKQAKHNAVHYKRTKEQRALEYKKLKDAALDAYGWSCKCCGETQREFLTIDHIDGNGAAHRREIKTPCILGWLKKHKYPAGFRILCFNCNCARGHYEQCPHELSAKGGIQSALPS